MELEGMFSDQANKVEGSDDGLISGGRARGDLVRRRDDG